MDPSPYCINLHYKYILYCFFFLCYHMLPSLLLPPTPCYGSSYLIQIGLEIQGDKHEFWIPTMREMVCKKLKAERFNYTAITRNTSLDPAFSTLIGRASMIICSDLGHIVIKAPKAPHWRYFLPFAGSAMQRKDLL